MKKFIFMIVAMFTMMVAHAQIAYEKASITDNAYIGIGGGVSTPMTMNSVFPVNPQMSIRLGKDLTPIFGVFVEGSALMGDNIGAHNVIGCFSNTWVRYTNVGVNGTINLSNLLLGYKGSPRKIEISTVSGLGWGHVISNNMSHRDDLTAKTGVDVLWTLNKEKSLVLYAEPNVMWNLSATDTKIQLNKNYAQLGLNLGLIYKFKTSNGTHSFKEHNITLLNNEINSLRDENAKKTKVIHTKPRVVEKVVTKEVNVGSTVIMFAQGKDELTEDAITTLNSLVGKVTKVMVEGYASPEGATELNKSLSYHRAANVADYLEKKGITVTSVEGKGVNGEASNRVAIVIAQ